MGNRHALLMSLGLTGCGSLLGISDLSGPIDAPIDTPPPIDGPAAECQAQRLVHIVGGNGGLSWFTLIWPLPAVIQNFSPTFAYDDPTKALLETTDPNHPLFDRIDPITGKPVFEGIGANPFVTAFLSGTNETHTQQPSSNMISGTNGLDAAATSLQRPFEVQFPVVVVGAAGPYGTAPGSASAVAVVDATVIPAALANAVVPASELTPTSAQLAAYLPGVPTAGETALATALATAANAFRHNVLTTLVVPGFNDDPHGAFDSNAATARADDLARMLDAFYADLATSNEPNCGHNGSFVSLADNTVLVVTGDTPKNGLMRTGWPDGTANNTNQFFLRSNGFIKPGWFGSISAAGAASFFDVTTGLPPGVQATDTQAAWASAVYAIARGNLANVIGFTSADFSGERAQ